MSQGFLIYLLPFSMGTHLDSRPFCLLDSFSLNSAGSCHAPPLSELQWRPGKWAMVAGDQNACSSWCHDGLWF